MPRDCAKILRGRPRLIPKIDKPEQDIAGLRGLGSTSRWLHGCREMDLDPKLGVLVAGDNIIVTLHGTSYSVTYYKPKRSSGLLAKEHC
jgi:hypothetical protein